MTTPTEAEDRRLATLHLRLGGLALARAELEDLGRRNELEPSGLADLAEARWRGGDLDSAAAAAAAHLAAGGSRPIARVILAEAAAADGRPEDARAQVDALGSVDAETLELLFAGMPRRAFWPAAPAGPRGPLEPRLGPGSPENGPDPAVAREGDGQDPRTAVSLGADEPGSTLGFWADDAPAPPRRATSRVRRRRSDRDEPVTPAEQLTRAREELSSADAVVASRGLARLALALRQDPGLAADVLRALGPRRGVEAVVLRGDASRLLGRHLEAEAAFAEAATLIDEPPGRPA